MTDDELLALAEQDTEYNDGINAYVAVHVVDRGGFWLLVVRHEDCDTYDVTVRKWKLVPFDE